MQTRITSPAQEPTTPTLPKRADPTPSQEPAPVRVPAPVPLPVKKPSFQPGREAPTHTPPQRMPRPLQPFCPTPE